MNRLKRSEWEVRPVAIDVARRIVSRWHYARGASNTATYLHGLFRRRSFFDEECLGIAWWLPPTRSAAEATYPANWRVTAPESVFTLDGMMTSRKAGPKTRTVTQMLALGAKFEGKHRKHKFALIREPKTKHETTPRPPPLPRRPDGLLQEG